MKRPPGQAARVLGWIFRVFAAVFLALFAIAAAGLGALAWRLDKGPLQIPYVASRLATAVSGPGVDVRIGAAALAWAGYRQGGGAPLYLQLTDITARNREGGTLATVPRARLLFPIRVVFGLAAPVDVAGQDAHLADVAAPVDVAALLRFGLGFALRGAAATVTLGPGTVGPPGRQLAILSGGFKVETSGADGTLTQGRLVLRPYGASAPTVTFSATAHRDVNWRATLDVAVDAVRAADLQYYWPRLAGEGARGWVTRNITAGVAKNGRLTAVLTAPADLSGLALQDEMGGFDAADLTLRWLPRATVITALNGRLAVLDDDTILITESTARLGGLAITGGTMRITGLDRRDQVGTVKLVAAGRLADAIAVLNAPPLSLLAAAPAALARATGDATIDVAATLPLRNDLRLASVRLGVDARLGDVVLPLPVVGSFSGGTVALRADETQLSGNGAGLLAGRKTTFAARLVYGRTPPLQHAEMTTVLGPAALAALGLADTTQATGAVAGEVPLSLVLNAAAGGRQDAALDADLTPARLGVPLFGWSKAAGQAGHLRITAVVAADQSVMVRTVAAVAPGLDARGSLRGRDLHLAPLVIGRTSAAGDVIFPAKPGAAVQVQLGGASLDARAILNPPANPKAAAAKAARQPPPGSAPAQGPAWRATLRFGILYLARPPAPALRDLVFSGSGAGDNVAQLSASAATASGQPVRLAIRPVAGRRDLDFTSGDGGAFLRALDAYDDLAGGTLELGAVYGGGGPFAGEVTLRNFQLLRAPTGAKILQALTIYGAPEAAAGPGLVFARLVAPFSIAAGVLTLTDARAYSASLGFTASGTVRLADGGCDLDATIIPAYALNALPGKIPVIGKLFTAEKGGGLFAARVKIIGLLTNPTVRLNPLSVLTPGVLRNIFGAAVATRRPPTTDN